MCFLNLTFPVLLLFLLTTRVLQEVLTQLLAPLTTPPVRARLLPALNRLSNTSASRGSNTASCTVDNTANSTEAAVNQSSHATGASGTNTTTNTVSNTLGTPNGLPLIDFALLLTLHGMFQQMMANQMQMFPKLMTNSRTTVAFTAAPNQSSNTTVSPTATPNQSSNTGTSFTIATTIASLSNGSVAIDGTELTF
jgi:hypothetical protein